MRAPAKPHYVTRKRLREAALVLGAILVSLVLWFVSVDPSLPWEDKPLRMWMLDVGQGDAIFFQLPTGEELLIDGGRSSQVLSKLSTILPPWDSHLDALVLTHTDADHVTGLVSVLEVFDIDVLMDTGHEGQTAVAQQWSEDHGIARRTLKAGDVLEYGEVVIRVLWPSDEGYASLGTNERNDLSLVLHVVYGETSLLLTGDAEEAVEEVLSAFVPDVDVLKVGHHGSLTSTSWSLLDVARPEYALIGVGEDNSYGHPHPIILSRLLEVGATVFRTDLDGTILVESYGDEPTVAPHPLPF